MKKYSLLILLVFSFVAFKVQDNYTSIVFRIELLQSDQDARDLQTELLRYEEKIHSAKYNLEKKEFILTVTEKFNRIEILQFFRDKGYEAYYMENGTKYMLNVRGNAVTEIQLQEKTGDPSKVR